MRLHQHVVAGSNRVLGIDFCLVAVVAVRYCMCCDSVDSSMDVRQKHGVSQSIKAVEREINESLGIPLSSVIPLLMNVYFRSLIAPMVPSLDLQKGLKEMQ